MRKPYVLTSALAKLGLYDISQYALAAVWRRELNNVKFINARKLCSRNSFVKLRNLYNWHYWPSCMRISISLVARKRISINIDKPSSAERRYESELYEADFKIIVVVATKLEAGGVCFIPWVRDIAYMAMKVCKLWRGKYVAGRVTRNRRLWYARKISGFKISVKYRMAIVSPEPYQANVIN